MVHLKSDEEIRQMRAAGLLASQTLDMIEKFIKPGVSTLELNEICHKFTIENGAIPASDPLQRWHLFYVVLWMWSVETEMFC